MQRIPPRAPRTLTPPRVEAEITLPDGRRIGMADYGPADGTPVLWFHGTPGGRYQIPESLRRSLADSNSRVVVIERPGYGRSTPHGYRNARDFSDDIGHVADALGFERFGVAALSGGGPYALAVSHGHPDRVVATAVLGGVVPHVGPESLQGGLVKAMAPLSGVARATSAPLGAAFGAVIRTIYPFKEPLFKVVVSIFPEGDREVFGIRDIQDMFLHDIKYAARAGLPGPALDLVQFTRDWGFSLADVRVPVHFWQGDADPIVTIEQAEKMASAIPDSTFNVRPGESHLGGFAVATEAIDAILGHWPE